MRTSTIRRCGVAVVAGSAAWAVCALIAGPIDEGANSRVELSGSLAFQLGLLGLVAAMSATNATGASRWGRAMLSVQTVLVLLAIGWTVPHIVEPNMDDEGLIVALEAAWPLGMLWLIVLGVMVARAHSWAGRLRWAPLVASLWFPVSIFASAAGDWPGLVVSSVWLFAAYGALGVWLIRGSGIDLTATQHGPGSDSSAQSRVGAIGIQP